MEEEDWESEGGAVLHRCSRCGKVKPLYEDSLCLPCYLIVNPINAGE